MARDWDDVIIQLHDSLLRLIVPHYFFPIHPPADTGPYAVGEQELKEILPQLVKISSCGSH